MFYTVGGFCEDYAQGVGYEDMDFMQCLEAAGARPMFRDDLVVLHPKAGAQIRWKPEMFARNKAIYERRWAC
jgi:predicted glycosyltransferase involved in capsule biosynthesis